MIWKENREPIRQVYDLLSSRTTSKIQSLIGLTKSADRTFTIWSNDIIMSKIRPVAAKHQLDRQFLQKKHLFNMLYTIGYSVLRQSINEYSC